MSDYVLLTGDRENSGDFLIRDRAESLLRKYRSDRSVEVMPAWKPLDSQQLERINKSRALLLTGGPALQPSMYPKVYPLVEELDQIKVPIGTFGVGWKSAQGDWQNVLDYPLSSQALQLLGRVNESAFSSSVRDFSTLAVLQSRGLSNFLMTGCPALYETSSDKISDQFALDPVNVGFSPGVGFVRSSFLDSLTRDLVVQLKEKYEGLVVAFHHPVKPEQYKGRGVERKLFLQRHLDFIDFLEKSAIKWVDLSNSVEGMKQFYADCDLHIGFRVHAHILMSSWNRSSVLLAEDGRGKALKDVLGGHVYPAFSVHRRSIQRRVANRLGLRMETFVGDKRMPSVLMSILDHEYGVSQGRSWQQVQNRISDHSEVMKRFLKGLP